MAGKKSKRLARLDGARSVLEDAVLDACQLVEAFELLAGEEVPPWLFTVSSRLQHVHHAVQGYMKAVHNVARPGLKPRELPRCG